MGYALRLPGLTITDTNAPKALLEAFGVSGITHRFEADSYTGAVGSAAGGWLNKIDNTTTAANTAGALVGPKVPTPAGTLATVDYRTGTTGDFGIDGLTGGAKTVAYAGVFYGTAKLFDIEGRKFWMNGTHWVLEKLDGTGTNKITIPYTTLPQPAAGTLFTVVAELSSDGSSDTIHILYGGTVTTASGPVDKTTSTRLRIGPGSHGANFGHYLFAVAIWPRKLTATEVTGTVLPAIKTRFGVPA